jgi:hypothetical protein
MADKTTDAQRELSWRANHGVEVVLFWRQDTDGLTVAVSDERSATYFELTAAPDQALDVFNHPYAYAGLRAAQWEDVESDPSRDVNGPTS